jgi:hypothetical protein
MVGAVWIRRDFFLHLPGGGQLWRGVVALTPLLNGAAAIRRRRRVSLFAAPLGAPSPTDKEPDPASRKC